MLMEILTLALDSDRGARVASGEEERCRWMALGLRKLLALCPLQTLSLPPHPQTRMNVSCLPRPVAAPPATTRWVASIASVPLALTLTRPWEAARMWMSVQCRGDPVATAVPTPLVASCAAAPEATSGLGKGEWRGYTPPYPGSVCTCASVCTHMCTENEPQWHLYMCMYKLTPTVVYCPRGTLACLHVQ